LGSTLSPIRCFVRPYFGILFQLVRIVIWLNRLGRGLTSPDWGGPSPRRFTTTQRIILSIGQTTNQEDAHNQPLSMLHDDSPKVKPGTTTPDIIPPDMHTVKTQ
jgi:hypothetical protein